MFTAINKSIDNRLNARREGEKGFTLVELLVVVIIIGILAAIAIPVFLNQRQAAWRGSVESDLRNAAIAAQTFATGNNGSYDGLTDATLVTAGFQETNDVNVVVTTATSGNYILTGSHDELPATTVITWDASLGGLQNWSDRPATPAGD